MENSYCALYKGGQGEITEKKSRFIASTFPVDSQEAAMAQVEAMKKKYWDARHNCYAFVVGENQQIQRASDDGEPQGTAGRPILDVLLGKQVHNALVVVTRYFGGTLLGTGGLIRAYTEAARAGLEASLLVEKIHGQKLRLTTDYNGIGKVQYILGRHQIPVADSIFAEEAVMELVVPLSGKEALQKELVEATSGKVRLEEGDPVVYALLEGQLLLE
jgi:uncharacterized YigZ family protein